MFKINPTFKVDVSIPAPGSKSEVLPIVFKHKTSTEIKKLIKQVRENDTDTTSKNNITLLYDCIESWEAD